MSQHADEAPYSCLSCNKVYKSLRFLQNHKCATSITKEKGEQPGTDPDGQEVSTVDGAEEDSGPADDKSVTEGPFYCPQCSAEFKCRQTFRYHLRNICYDEQQVDPEKTEDDKHCFKCDQCDKAFKYKSTLDSHKQTHNPLYCHTCMKLVPTPRFSVITVKRTSLCSKLFINTTWMCTTPQSLHLRTLSDHLCQPQTLYPSRVETYRIPAIPMSTMCKRFRSYSDLVEHQKKHTKAYPYLCWECGKKFRHSLTLTRHVARVHHSGEPVMEKPAIFGCVQCGKMFTSRRCLLKHDNFHHKGLRFPCEHCGKGFFGKDALVRHTLIHTGERPFKCDDCDKSFRSLAELKIHRRYHTGERPFKCTICEKGFVQSCFLTLHMRTHTGERPYVCAVCNKGFSRLMTTNNYYYLFNTFALPTSALDVTTRRSP
uniref:C2H2-type domain-containing protein n=1 Tax=Neogobius melanostomus TaxID=47308 RepID=A0A8C6T396_9GOBI